MERTLKALRVSRKFTLKDLAARVGCSSGTLAVYETNPPAVVNQKIILNLARVLEVTPEYILKLLGSTAASPAKSKADARHAKGQTKLTKKPKTRRTQGEPKTSTKTAAVFTEQQAVLLMTLVRAEIKRLREFIVQAEGRAVEDGTLKAVVQDTYADLQILQSLNRLIIKVKSD
jgi:transcriptional regulator with XRE-family HTH domain